MLRVRRSILPGTSRSSLPARRFLVLLVSAVFIGGCGGQTESGGVASTVVSDRAGSSTTQPPAVRDEWTVLLAEIVDGPLLEPIAIDDAQRPDGVFVLATDRGVGPSGLTLLRLGASGELDWVVELSGVHAAVVWRGVLPALESRDDGSVEILRLRTARVEQGESSHAVPGAPELVLTRVSDDGVEIAEVVLGIEGPTSADTDGSGETASLTLDGGQAVVRVHGIDGSSLWATEVGQPAPTLADEAFSATVSPRVILAEDGVYVATAEPSDDPAALRGMWTASWSLSKLNRETGEAIWTVPLQSAVTAMDVIESGILVGQADPGQAIREGMLIEVYSSDGSLRSSVQAPRSYTTPYAVSVQGSRAILLTDAEGTDTGESVLQAVEDGALVTIGSFGMFGIFGPSTWATDVAALGDGSLAITGYHQPADPDIAPPNVSADTADEGGFVAYYPTANSAESLLRDAETCGQGC